MSGFTKPFLSVIAEYFENNAELEEPAVVENCCLEYSRHMRHFLKTRGVESLMVALYRREKDDPLESRAKKRRARDARHGYLEICKRKTADGMYHTIFKRQPSLRAHYMLWLPNKGGYLIDPTLNQFYGYEDFPKVTKEKIYVYEGEFD